MPAKESLAMHYLQASEEHLLNIKLAGLVNEWSQPFAMNQLGVLYLKVGKTGSEEEDLIKIEVLLDGAGLFIILSREEGRWPISIENNSDQDIVCWQHECNCHYLVQKHSVRPYAWDQPSRQSKLLIVHVNGKEKEVDVSEIGNFSYIRYPVDMKGSKHRILSVQVVAEGPVLVIRIAQLGDRRGSDPVSLRKSAENSSRISVSSDRGSQYQSSEVRR